MDNEGMAKERQSLACLSRGATTTYCRRFYIPYNHWSQRLMYHTDVFNSDFLFFYCDLPYTSKSTTELGI